jgi:hypothetical protein
MQIMVNSDQLINAPEDQKLAEVINGGELKVKSITSRIEMTLPAEATLKKAIDIAIEEIRVLQSNFISMSKILSSCAEIYSKCQMGLLNDIRTLETSVYAGSDSSYGDMPANVPAPDSTKAFDTVGAYGGNQGAPADNFMDYANIVRKYYPDMTDADVEKYLKKLNNEGCGYVAIVNTAFVNYEGREDDFKKTFGFEMYDENGEPNYNELLVDFYCDQDNHNKKSFLFWSWDTVDKKEDWDWKDLDNDGVETYDEYGFGTWPEQREYRWEQYCKDKGVEVNVINNVDVAQSNYEELSKNGMILISTANFYMYDENGVRTSTEIGSHCMTLTGFTEDGKYIVSSWGQKYTIDPADIDYSKEGTYINFQQVVYQ